MSQGKLQQVASKYRAQLLAHEAQTERHLHAAYQHVLALIQPKLDALYREIAGLQKDGGKVPPTWLYERQRLKSTKQVIQNAINQFGQSAQSLTEQMQHVGASLGLQLGTEQLEATVPVGYSYQFGVPSTKAISELVGTLQDGSPLDSLFRGFGEEAADLAGSALIKGVGLGYNPRQIAKDMQDALGVSRNRALTISRQEMLRPYKQAALETYKENPDVVNGWVWNADLSARTCAMCISMNGTVHDVSEDFESHVCCRCSPSPQTNSWADILGPDVDLSDIEETSPKYQDGSEWFDQQSADVQRQILGNAGYEAYKDGAVSLSDFVGKSHSEQWGGSRYQKSLKQILGTKDAQKYYKKAS